jgi:hypothetical protein
MYMYLEISVILYQGNWNENVCSRNTFAMGHKYLTELAMLKW